MSLQPHLNPTATLLPPSLLLSALKDHKRGPPRGRTLLNPEIHGPFILQLLRDEYDLYLHEILQRVRSAFPTLHCSISTLCFFIKHTLALSRKRKSGAPIPGPATMARSLDRRKAFVRTWFGDSADMSKVGTVEEHADQANWRVRHCESKHQCFFIDETGVNWHTTRRRHGRVPRNTPCSHRATDACQEKGPNHSVIIAMHAGARIMTHDVLIKKKHATRRSDYVAFLKDKVVPAMAKHAEDHGLSRQHKLFLFMDNASIHKGDIVKEAVQACSHPAEAVYLPPYASTMNPVELVNHALKQRLKGRRAQWLAERPQPRHHGHDDNDGKTLLAKFINDIGHTLMDEDATSLYRACGWN